MVASYDPCFSDDNMHGIIEEEEMEEEGSDEEVEVDDTADRWSSQLITQIIYGNEVEIYLTF